MPFRPKKKQPSFADLKGILAQGKDTDNALYQTVQEIIERLGQFQSVTLDEIKENKEDAAKGIVVIKDATYLTTENETLLLPNSVQLLAGTGITFNDTVSNQRVINSTGGSGSGYWTPLTDGDPDETDLIYANGECIAVFIPV